MSGLGGPPTSIIYCYSRWTEICDEIKSGCPSWAATFNAPRVTIFFKMLFQESALWNNNCHNKILFNKTLNCFKNLKQYFLNTVFKNL